jgi:hypothetical protein
MYEEEHNKVLPHTSKWFLPESQVAVNEARKEYMTNFYCDAGVSDLEAVSAEDKLNRMDCESDTDDDEIQEHHEKLWSHIISTKVESLPAMLCKLYDSLDQEDFAAGLGFINWNPNGKRRVRIQYILLR